MKKPIDLRKKKIECQVLENVIFTDISIQNLRKTSVVILAPLVEIAAHQNQLPIFYPRIGACISHKSWLHAMDHIEKSVLYN